MSPAETPEKPLKDAAKKRPTSSDGMLKFILFLALLLALAASTAGGYFYLINQQKVSDQLQRQMGQLGAMLESQRNDSDTLRADLLNRLQSAAQSQENALAQWSKQSNQNIKSILQSITETADHKSHSIQQAIYLIQSAGLSLLIAGGRQHALVYLSQADAVLSRYPDQKLPPVRSQLASILAELKNQNTEQLNELHLSLSKLNEKLAELPLALSWQPQLETRDAQNSAHPVFERVFALFRVRTEANPIARTPQLAELGRQHLSLLLAQGQTALLRQDQALYANALGAAKGLLTSYFDEQSAVVTSFNQELEKLAQADIAFHQPDLQPIIRLLEAQLTASADSQ